MMNSRDYLNYKYWNLDIVLSIINIINIIIVFLCLKKKDASDVFFKYYNH